MDQLGHTHFDQHSKNIARFRPEIFKANLLRGATSLESLIGMNFQGCAWTRTLARQVVQFSFGYSNCPLNPAFRSTAPQTPSWQLSTTSAETFPQWKFQTVILPILDTVDEQKHLRGKDGGA